MSAASKKVSVKDAERVITEYMEHSPGIDRECVLRDLLADLRHWVDAEAALREALAELGIEEMRGGDQ